MAKARVNRYNVYDNGKLIIRNATNGEVLNELGCTTINIPTYADKKLRYQGRYTFEISGTEERKFEDDFEREWNKTVRLFRNVVWVKKGGRKLHPVRF